MHKIKIFLTLLIVHCTLLIGTASAQWWVQGGNLLWPYGDVTIQNDLNVEGTITNDGVRPYKVYTAIINQSGTANPVATVLENTLGFDVNFVYLETGVYEAQHIGGFPAGKTFLSPPIVTDDRSDNLRFVFLRAFGSDAVTIYCKSGVDASTYSARNDVVDVPIEIRVYP